MKLNKLKRDLERIFNDKNVMFIKLSEHATATMWMEEKCDAEIQF